MKTAHQLAKELLAGPDLPVWIYRDVDGDEPEGQVPEVRHVEGYTKDGDDHEVIEVYAGKSFFD